MVAGRVVALGRTFFEWRNDVEVLLLLLLLRTLHTLDV